MRVLIVGRNVNEIRRLRDLFVDAPGIEVRAKPITNGHADPLHGVDLEPDVVVLHCGPGQSADLAAWMARPTERRPALIVVGPAGQADITRLAIRSGARDFLAEPVNPADLIAAVQQVGSDRRSEAQEARGAVHVFVGATGGAGSSFIAANVAHMLAAHSGRKAVLVDLDLNFAPTGHHLNLTPERGLIEALEEAATLDESALEGFGARHSSGLRLFCSTAKHAVLSKDIPPDRLSAFLSLLLRTQQDVVIDAPHSLDALTATAFGLASEIYLILQQSTLHVRNATRMVRILRDELGVSPARLRIIVNRYSKDSVLQLDDVSRALGVGSLSVVPSYYQRALASSDSGVPLYEADRNAAITKALLEVVAQMTGTASAKPGLLRRVLPGFLRT